MDACYWIDWLTDRFANHLSWKWVRGLCGGALVCAGLSGCDPVVKSSAPPTLPPAPPVATPNPTPDSAPPNAAAPGEHVRTPGGTAVDVNPPGGGVHVNVPPGPNGDGVHVDVGPGGINVTSPDSQPAP